MNLEDEFLTIRRVDKDPFPPTELLKEIAHTVEDVVYHLTDTECIILQEYYILMEDGNTILFFGWRDMEVVESFVCPLDDARRICETTFKRR